MVYVLYWQAHDFTGFLGVYKDETQANKAKDDYNREDNYGYAEVEEVELFK